MRKQCRRKVRQLTNPIVVALEGCRVTEASILDAIRLRELSAIESFRLGNAGKAEWRDLCAMTNLAEALANWGYGREALEACDRAHAALEEAATRFDRTGRMVLTGPGLVAVRDVYEYHDLQRQSCTRSEYERCLNHLQNLVRSAHPSIRMIRRAA